MDEKIDVYNIRKEDENFPYIDYPVGKKTDVEIAKRVGEALGLFFEGKRVLFACRGSSGMFMASIAATYIENCSIHYIRKLGESSHAKQIRPRIEGSVEIVIIDDFISSGETVNQIYDNLMEYDDLSNEVYLALGNFSDYHISRLNFQPKIVFGFMEGNTDKVNLIN